MSSNSLLLLFNILLLVFLHALYTYHAMRQSSLINSPFPFLQQPGTSNQVLIYTSIKCSASIVILQAEEVHLPRPLKVYSTGPKGPVFERTVANQ